MSSAPQALGRPRQPDIDRRLLAATVELLTEVGYARFTVDAVARKAKVGKPAIYRRYSSRTELILAALFADAALLPKADVVDTGSLAGDLTAEAAGLLSLFGSPVARAAVPGLVADLAADEALSERAEGWFVGANLADVEKYLHRERVRRHVQRLGPGDDARLVQAVLVGTVFAWVGMMQWEAEADLAAQIGALAAAGASASASQANRRT